MENKNKTVIESIDETKQNVSEAKEEIVEFIRNANIQSNISGRGFNWTNLFQTCTAVAIERRESKSFKSRIMKTNIFFIVQMILSLVTFIFASIYIKKASMGGIAIAIAVAPFIVLFIRNLRMKPAMLTYKLVENCPVYYKVFQGNVIRVTNRCSAAVIWFDILVCISTFLDCGEVAVKANIDKDLDYAIFSVMFILFIAQCVLSGIFANRIKKYFQHYCIFYVNGFVQNNGIKPIEAIVDPTDAQVIFTLDEYNSRYPYFSESSSVVAEELKEFASKRSKKKK